MQLYTGPIRKMSVKLAADTSVAYELPLGEQRVPLNALLGQKVTLRATGAIRCVACGRDIKKSFQQGYCYPCTQKLAQCDLCVLKPSLCHFDRGTCREPVWGEAHCQIPHLVYLANSSGLKVGITRQHQQVTRWIDQGAVMALPLCLVRRRYDAGLIEEALKAHVTDRTDWRRMLKGGGEAVDLKEAREKLLALIPASVSMEASQDEPLCIQYPVLGYPEKVEAINLDKEATVTGTLTGIKGQYLIFDAKRVLNVRKYAGYVWEFGLWHSRGTAPVRREVFDSGMASTSA